MCRARAACTVCDGTGLTAVKRQVAIDRAGDEGTVCGVSACCPELEVLQG